MPGFDPSVPRVANGKKSRSEKIAEALTRADFAAKNGGDQGSDKYAYPICPPALIPGVVPEGITAPVIAKDSMPYDHLGGYGSYGIGGGFPGFAYLATLATRPEYRAFASAMATEITRKWITITGPKDSAGDDIADKIKAIEAEIKRIGLRKVIQASAESECYFGRAQIFIDMKGADQESPMILDRRTIKVGSLAGIKNVEAIWTTPSDYNALDPGHRDFYRPTSWYMMGKKVHASRLITIITRPLPDILKPLFNFAGMSLSQLAEPYVDNWLRTRKSVSDLINNFSMTVLATDMSQLLQGDSDGVEIIKRAKLFATHRSNNGLMLLDREREEVSQINTPLSGLHELQAQSQEHMCSVSRLPALVLTGISPSGLNATSEGEIRIFYDWISAQQEAHWRRPIETIIDIIQLSLFGEIDPGVIVSFEPLHQMTPKEKAEIRETDGRTACAYIDSGVLDPSETRERLSADAESGYHGLDTGVEIVPPEEDIDGMQDA